MVADPLGQIHATTRTEMGAASQKIRGQLVLPEVLGTPGAFGYRVVEAVLEEQCALFLAEAARSSAIKMHDLVAVK